MFILERLEGQLAAAGLTPDETRDDYDLLSEGVIDSFGVVEMILELEQRFGVTLDFEDADLDDITEIGPLSAYVATLIEQRR